MYSFLLKKALPFTLTFIFGAALGGLLGLFGHSEKKTVSCSFTRTYDYGSHCRMRRHNLVAESKPLNIISVPAADIRETSLRKIFTYPMSVDVTFGADGLVQKVEPAEGWPAADDDDGPAQSVWEAVEQAARQIRFEPETINGMPVTVIRKVEIPFLHMEHYAAR